MLPSCKTKHILDLLLCGKPNWLGCFLLRNITKFTHIYLRILASHIINKLVLFRLTEIGLLVYHILESGEPPTCP